MRWLFAAVALPTLYVLLRVLIGWRWRDPGYVALTPAEYRALAGWRDLELVDSV